VGNARQVDVVVLGAGAAGMMCAIEAGRRGRRVLVIDHAERAGKKILISGGGRCNFTNVHTRAENFLSENPHFAKSALARFTPQDMIALVEKHGIPYHEKTLGQLFCYRTAHDVVKMLEQECAEASVKFSLGTAVAKVEKEGEGFRLETSAGAVRARSVAVATGGLSIPKMGATGFGYDLATQFGLKVIECRPGLVPLVFSAEDRERWCDLSGLSVEVVASARLKAEFREKMLVTHRGLSGPAVLQVSSYWRPGQEVRFDLAPERAVMAPLLARSARREVSVAVAALKAVMPARMAERWMELEGPADWTNLSIARLEERVHGWRVTPAGTDGYAKAEVTVGGVDTAELDAKTMQARRVPGLFFIGEVVDVTGWLGGYNFQWAWASGVSAGLVA
jgi:predicted Rossmann fold flavoprotein